MNVYHVTYWYQSEKYSGGQYDTLAEARSAAYRIRIGIPGATNVAVSPVRHEHYRYCSHPLGGTEIRSK